MAPLPLAGGRGASVDAVASFVDGIGSGSVLADMWPVARELLDGSLVSTLAEVAEAVRVLAERNRVIIEGAAACAVAAALSGRAGAGKVVAIVSGGNVDLEKFGKMVGAA